MKVLSIADSHEADLSARESNLIVQMLAQLLHYDPQVLSFAVRKAAHFTEYLLLGSILVTIMREHGRGGILAWSIGSAYAITDEAHQYYVPGRSCELRDMCIESCGVLTGVLLGLLILYLRKERLKN